MRILIKNIKKLLQTYHSNDDVVPLKGQAMKNLPFLENAFVIIDNKRILDFGEMKSLNTEQHFDEEIDATNSLVMPGYVDSHTHLVHATTREDEFVQRIQGASYAEIAANGGGILNSAAKLANCSEDDLYASAWQRLQKAIAMGTTTIEIKSGYGLSVASELKMLRVIARLKENSPIPIKASLLAAHAYPMEYKQNHQGYIDIIINEILPVVAAEQLADYMDVFCEEGFFSVAETSTLLNAAAKYGLKPKIHANQLAASGGVQVGVLHNAISVDHLECVGQAEVDALLNSNTLPVLLPGAAYFLGMHYQPARMLIDAGLPIVLASDYNPGSCPSYNMNTIQSLACTQMKMLPSEALNASTINAACTLELQHEIGVIKKGYRANICILKDVHNEALIPYAFGENLISQVLV
jgi:imidazolonepropionase